MSPTSNIRRRLIAYTENPLTFAALRNAFGRQSELIASTDFATAEAALRLYKKIDGVIVEKASLKDTAIKVLSAAQNSHPEVARVMLVHAESVQGVYEAVRARTITHLQFLPLDEDTLFESVGMAKRACVSGREPLLPAMLTRGTNRKQAVN